MNNKDIGNEQFAPSESLLTLRQKAEMYACNHVTQSHEEMQKTLHELYIYQIELEMQNEELCRVHAELNSKTKLLESVIENIPDAFIIFNKNGNLIHINAAGRLLYPRLDMVDTIASVHNGFKCFDMEGNEILSENLPAHRAFKGETIRNEVFVIKRLEKEQITEVNATPIYDEDNNLVSMVCYHRDITEKVHSEIVLKESETKYKDLFNNMLRGHAYYQIITDKSGKLIDYIITEVNPAYETITGLKRNWIIGKKASELLLEIDYAKADWIRIFGEVALTGKSVSWEDYSSLTNKWYEGSCYCTKPGYLASIFSDITDRKNNEEKLKQTRERLQEAQEFAHLGYFELDTLSGNYFWSDELFRIFGFKPQEFEPTNDDLMKIVHPDDKDLVCNTMEIPSDGSEQELEFRIIRQENETRWIHGIKRYVFNSAGKLVRIIGVVRDITMQKLSELKLKESEEKFREVAENLGEVIWVREGGQLVYISPAYEKVWGRTCQSLYDNSDSFIESIHPEDNERVKLTYLIPNDNSKGLSYEQYRIIRPDGTIRWIWSRKYPIYDRSGRMIRLVGISEDITRIKDFEDLLRKVSNEAENANRAKSQFLANMSHEIRTPMTSIIGMTDIMLTTDLTEEQRHYFSIIKSSTRVLSRTLNQILNYSKIEAGKVTLEQVPFDIRETIYDIVDLFNVSAKQKNINIVLTSIDKNIPENLIGDSPRLKHVLLNLIDNGIKFTNRGEVTIGISIVELDQRSIRLKFIVADSGIGIPEDKLDKLFERFSQVDDSNTREFGGIGLGLAISKKLVELMDGEIYVESKEGIRSEFYFTAKFRVHEEGVKIS